MKGGIYLVIFAVFLVIACNKEDEIFPDAERPLVRNESSYTVLMDENITYAEGLAHNSVSLSPFVMPLKLDVYYPNNSSNNRPVYLFVHGGGFKGGTKTKPEIVSMANYFVSRGWVFASIDYRTTENLGNVSGMTLADIRSYYRGIAPSEWVNHLEQNASSSEELVTGVAMYTAQRDAKAALRWIMANSNRYHIAKDYITVGGASAGAITTIALGISNSEDFRDEIAVSDDSTLSTTNLDETYEVKSMIYFWGSNIKLELFEAAYGLNRYDANDPELFMAHGTEDQNTTTTFSEATELKGIFNSLGIYNKLIPLEGAGHGAWNATVNGQNLSELSFDFIVERQNLIVE